MIDKQFDDILKRKLNNMTDASNSDWSAFERKLANAQSTDTSGKSGFDNAIKQKFAGMTAASVSSDWSTFEHMLDQDQLTDQMLDDKVSEEMNNMRAPYRRDHWELLHDNLELQKTRNQNIIGYKIIELSLLFIILLSANNLYKYLPSTFEVEKPMIYASLDRPMNKDVQNTEGKNSINGSSISSVALEADNTITTNSLEASIEARSSIAAINTFRISDESMNITRINSIYSEGIDGDILTSSNEITNEVAFNAIVVTNSVVNATRDMKNTLDGINVINPSLNYNRKVIDEAARFTPHILYPKTSATKSMTVYAGIDNNLVNSPFDDVYDVEGFRTYGIGYSAGIDYGIKRGRKEFTIGIGYSNRSYEPRIIDELTGDAVVNLFDTSLEHIEFDILSLTAGYKYTLKETDNWAIDFGIGASANFVAHTNYQIETVSILRDGQYVSSRVNNPKGLDLNAKPLHDGINEGGSLQENIYLTTDISLGLQRKMSKNTFFTLRPEYSLHSFSNGIGPNNDLINNLSLNLGVKYIL